MGGLDVCQLSVAGGQLSEAPKVFLGDVWTFVQRTTDHGQRTRLDDAAWHARAGVDAIAVRVLDRRLHGLQCTDIHYRIQANFLSHLTIFSGRLKMMRDHELRLEPQRRNPKVAKISGHEVLCDVLAKP